MPNSALLGYAGHPNLLAVCTAAFSKTACFVQLLCMHSSVFYVLQAAISKSQRNCCQHSTPDTKLPIATSKACSTKGKQPTMPVTDGQAASGRLPRLRRASHTDTDTQVKKSEGHVEQVGPSQKVGTSSGQQQRRSLRHPTQAQGGQHALDLPAAGGVHVKQHSMQGLRTSLTAGKGKSQGARLAGTDTEHNAQGPKQAAGALMKGKKAAGSGWEPAELEVPFGPSAKGKKASGSKGHLKGLPAQSVSKTKSPVGTEQRATAVTQSPAHEEKPALDAKEEPAACPVPGDKGEQQSPGASHPPFGLGKGKRKRIVTKPLHMQEDSKAEKQAGSKHQGVGGKLKEGQVYRYAHTDLMWYLRTWHMQMLLGLICSLRGAHPGRKWKRLGVMRVSYLIQTIWMGQMYQGIMY